MMTVTNIYSFRSSNN